MKAAQYSEYGGPEVITISKINKPAPADGQVLVEVKAAAINPFDWKLRSGMMKNMIPMQFPVTIGADFSGVVVSPAGDYKVGDEVFGSAIILNGGSGAAAEFAAANTANISTKPADVGFAEAASLVLVGVSAIQALDQLSLGDGKRILIHGGAGGIGSAAIQYAKHLGAYVATTAKAKDTDYVKGLGADEVVDYENQLFEDDLRDMDAVFDTVGADTYIRSFNVLREGGIIISMNVQPDEALAKEKGIVAYYQSTQVNHDSLERLRGLVEQGIIKPQIDRQFPIDEAAEAFRHLEAGHPQGKVVINLSNQP